MCYSDVGRCEPVNASPRLTRPPGPGDRGMQEALAYHSARLGLSLPE